MVVEILIAKGLVALGHLAAAHMTAGTAAAIVHAVAGMTIGQLATATVTAGFVAGCVTWTADRIKNVKNGALAISNGNYREAIKEFGSLAISSNIGVDMLPDAVEAALEKMHLSNEETRKVTSWVKDHETEIANYVKNMK